MTLVAVLFALAGFVALVGLLAAKNAHRTDGRACCAPADPRQDLRMRAADDDHLSARASPRSRRTFVRFDRLS
jgi:hypothetical protein